MGLNERRKVKELQDVIFPGRTKEIAEICGAFTVTAPSDATPSAVNGPASLSIEDAYQLQYSYQIADPYQATPPVETRFLPVYVPANPTNNLSISVQSGPVDVYGYLGLCTLHSLKDTWGGFWGLTPPVCDPNNSTPSNTYERTYMQNALASWRQQGITGITLALPLCDSEFGTGILVNCDGTNGGAAIDSNWIGYFEAFLNDLAANGFTSLSLRPAFGSSLSNGRLLTSRGLYNGCGSDPLNMQYELFVPTLPSPLMSDVSGNFSIYSSLNLAYDCYLFNPGAGQSDAVLLPGGDTQTINYAPGASTTCDPTGNGPVVANCGNFVGWPLILQAFYDIFQEMSKTNVKDPVNGTYRTQKINLESLDLSSEQDIAQGETVLMRMVFDNQHPQFLDAQSPPNWPSTLLPSVANAHCPEDVVHAGVVGTDFLGWMRCIANYSGMDPGVITMSANERLPYVDSTVSAYVNGGTINAGTDKAQPILKPQVQNMYQITAPAAAKGAWDCLGYYGDSSRADDGSMFVNALLGHPFGDSGDPKYYPPGRALTTGLYCEVNADNGALPSGSPGALVSLPVAYTLQDVYDWHSYPCLISSMDSHCAYPAGSANTRTTNAPDDPQAVQLTYREAAAQDSAFRNLIATYGSTQTALLQISETFSPTNVSAYWPNTNPPVPYGNFTCESWDGTYYYNPAVDPRLSFVGLRQSTAATAGPAGNTYFTGTRIRPIYGMGTLSGPQPTPPYPAGGINYGWCEAPVPLDVKDNGYDKTQP